MLFRQSITEFLSREPTEEEKKHMLSPENLKKRAEYILKVKHGKKEKQ